jgi:hypothetical protein
VLLERPHATQAAQQQIELAGLPAFARRLQLPEDSGGYGRIVVDGGPVEDTQAFGLRRRRCDTRQLTGAFPGHRNASFLKPTAWDTSQCPRFVRSASRTTATTAAQARLRVAQQRARFGRGLLDTNEPLVRATNGLERLAVGRVERNAQFIKPRLDQGAPIARVEHRPVGVEKDIDTARDALAVRASCTDS